MVSLPDFDANKQGDASNDERFNRAVTGMYEPGSTFKLQTAAMSLDLGVGKLWYSYDAAHDIKIGRFTITDFQGKHRALTFPEVIAYSSNLGAAHMAQAVGSERQRTWLHAMGMFGRIGVELPEAGQPIVQRAENWKEIATMTVGFGHGIAVSPLHVVRGTAAIANGGLVLRPTILALDPGSHPEGTRVMQQSTSDTMRKLMRLVVTDGYGKPADVAGYFVGGKTGTAEKTAGRGYRKHANISAFMSVFPMNAPRYAVYFMLDEPKGNASTGGYSTAGAVSAPGAGRVIARIAPMLGMMPETDDGRRHPGDAGDAALGRASGRGARPGAHAAAGPHADGAHPPRRPLPRPRAGRRRDRGCMRRPTMRRPTDMLRDMGIDRAGHGHHGGQPAGGTRHDLRGAAGRPSRRGARSSPMRSRAAPPPSWPRPAPPGPPGPRPARCCRTRSRGGPWPCSPPPSPGRRRRRSSPSRGPTARPARRSSCGRCCRCPDGVPRASARWGCYRPIWAPPTGRR